MFFFRFALQNGFKEPIEDALKEMEKIDSRWEGKKKKKETKKTFLLVPSGSKELRLAGFGKAVLRVMQNVKCYIFFFFWVVG